MFCAALHKDIPKDRKREVSRRSHGKKAPPPSRPASAAASAAVPAARQPPPEPRAPLHTLRSALLPHSRRRLLRRRRLHAHAVGTRRGRIVVDGPRPPQWAAALPRRRAEGAGEVCSGASRAGVKQIGWGVPQRRGDRAGAAARARRHLGRVRGHRRRRRHRCARRTRSAPIAIARRAGDGARSGELITVRGGGFGPSANARRRRVARAAVGPRASPPMHACKGAAWSDAVVSACVPAAARGRSWQLRVQVGGDARRGAPKPLVVAP